MSTPVRLAGFAVVLVAVFALAVGVGSAVGPLDVEPEGHGEAHAAEEAGAGHGAEHGAEAEQAGHGPAGLAVSQDGYTLDLADDSLPSGRAVPLSFRVLDETGHPVTDYTPTHDRQLHLIAVRRDLAGFQHVHPTLSATGQWRTDLELTPGSWRVFADFRPAGHGESLTLGADAAVAGRYRPAALPQPSTTATVGDYTVGLDGELVPGEASELTLTVARDGRPVTDLQPYLAAYGHLVALRAGDLGYLHVHPEGEPGDGQTEAGAEIGFVAEVPSAGDYRLFLDFKHDGVVRTAAFTARAADRGHDH